MQIILKADDLAGYPGKKDIVSKRWQRFVDIIEKYKIKATIGIIGNSLLFDDIEYFNWIKSYHKKGIIEFWNHGFLHREFFFDDEVYQEFRGTNYEYQLKLIECTNKLAKEKLDIEFKTFGAPYNATDETTSKVLNNSNITHWLFGLDSFNKRNIFKRIDIEYPTHVVNLKYFKDNFKEYDYAIIQVHPNSWDENFFIDFEKMIEFLLENKSEFILAKDLK